MSARRILATASALAATAVSLTSPADAQTLFAWDGAGAVSEFEGGAGGACPSATGPLIQGYPILGPAPCPLPVGGPGPIPGGPGGVAYDASTDLVYVSDGVTVASYTATGGAFVDSFVLSVPFVGFGLGLDAVAGVLWTTDGAALAAGVAIPPVPLCGAPAPLAVPPFPLPPAPAPTTAIDWDPLGGFLWLGDLAGNVRTVFPGGAPGPFGLFPIAAGGCFPPTAPVADLTVDTASGVVGELFVTDGAIVARILPGGPPAPPSFAWPAPCTPAPAPPIRLASAVHGTPWGVGSDPTGLLPPVASTRGAVAAFGAPLTHAINGAVPGSVVALYASGVPSCPPFPLLGVGTYLSPFAPLVPLGPVLPAPTGSAAIATPIPPTAPLGLQLHTQWLVVTPGFTLQTTNAVGLRVGTF